MKRMVAVVAAVWMTQAASGAVTFNLLGLDGQSQAVASRGDTVRVNLNLDLSEDQVPVGGIAFILRADKANLVTFTAVIRSHVLTELLIYPPPFDPPWWILLGPTSTKDVGAASPDPDVGISSDETVMELKLRLISEVPAGGITIYLHRVYPNTTGDNAEQFAGTIGTSFRIVPEPAAVLLGAFGGMWIARRRKA